MYYIYCLIVADLKDTSFYLLYMLSYLALQEFFDMKPLLITTQIMVWKSLSLSVKGQSKGNDTITWRTFK